MSLDDIPEWVFIWNYARRIRKPRNLMGFPQQKGEVDKASLMSEDEYLALRDEWIAVGSPKVGVEELLTVPSSPPSVVEHTIGVLQEVADD